MLTIREKQIKTAMKYHLTSVRTAIIKSLQITNAGEGVEKREPLCTVDGNISCCNIMGIVGRFLKKLKIELPYNPTILLLDVHPDKNVI